ncbi:putative signal transducing protein [Brumimicrobium sp.]|uniref:putative signal transducing protein n=1 Tax=Brumimicrobium sp. TaxID=2029867 RepID=UPI00345B72E9
MWKKIKSWIQKILPNNTEFDQNKLVFRTSELYLAQIIKLKLEEEGVHVILINKMDTSYNNFGQIELYVNQNDVIRAKYIIDKPNE